MLEMFDNPETVIRTTERLTGGSMDLMLPGQREATSLINYPHILMILYKPAVDISRY